MPRPILPEAHIHPAMRDRVAQLHEATLREVQAALAQHAVVVVGMSGNPFVPQGAQGCWMRPA
jgi:monothiol glutaredoxin